MKSRFLHAGVILASLLFGAGAIAHPPGEGCNRHAMDPEARMEKLTSALDLYPDQVPQVEAILAESQAQMRAIRETNSAQRDQVRADMKLVREETRQQLATVLTAEQLEKMEQIRGQYRGQKRHKRGRSDQQLEAVQPVQPPETAN